MRNRDDPFDSRNIPDKPTRMTEYGLSVWTFTFKSEDRPLSLEDESISCSRDP